MIPLHDDNPTRSMPVVTVTLIVINVLVFLAELANPGLMAFAMVPANVLQQGGSGTYLTFITSMFLHGSWMHLIGNMLYLWIFGNNIEDAMGKIRYIVFYLLCGIAAAAAHLLSAPRSEIPVVGASGAISGVLGAYLLLYPHARVMTLVPLGFYSRMIYVPSWVLLVFWFVMQLFSGWVGGGEGDTGGVAFWAHVGGFIAGLALVPIFKARDVPFFAQRHSGTLSS
jgi:rhomboid family protein